jgi:hypothetical protein
MCRLGWTQRRKDRRLRTSQSPTAQLPLWGFLCAGWDLVHPLDGSPDLVVGTMKKRFVSGNLFFELEIVNKSTISITLRVIDKSYPSFTGPLVIISRETNFRYYQVLQSPKEVLQYRSLDHQCTRFGVTTHQDVRLVMKSQSWRVLSVLLTKLSLFATE